jgi:hypothetical protein
MANSEELAGKADVCVVMMIKREAINVAFGSVALVPLSSAVGGALLTSSVTSTLSGRPPALEPKTPIAHAPALGAHGRGGATLSHFGDLRPSPGSTGSSTDLNRTPLTGCATPTNLKKPCCVSTADMPSAVNLFDDMPDHTRVPTDMVMTHPTCQLPLPVGQSASP